MKRISLLLSLLAMASVFFSCQEKDGPDGPAALAKPALRVESIESNAFSIKWEEVENASNYTYYFQDRTEHTSKNVLRFENLRDGSYTVKVRANAARHSGFANSEYSEITVQMDGDIYEISVTDIEWNAATISCTPNNDKTYLFDILQKGFYDTFASDEEMVASYLDYAMGTGLPMRYIVKLGESSFPLKGLVADTDYVVFAVGVDLDGNITSKVFTELFRTGEMPPVDPELEKWFGTWTATSENTFRWAVENNKVVFQTLDQPKTFDVKIYGDPTNYEQALIDGWASCKQEYPVIAALDNDNGLMVISDVVMDAADEKGFVPKWGSFSRISKEGSEDRYSLIYGQFPAYTFTMNGNKAESEPFSDARPDGSTFTVVAFDIFRTSDAGYTLYLDKDGNIPDMASGKVTLTKKASSAPSFLMLEEMNLNK